MGTGAERLGLVIETSRTGTAIPDTIRDVTQVGEHAKRANDVAVQAARQHSAALQQLGRNAMDMAHNRVSAEQKARIAAAQGAKEREEQLKIDREGVNESIRMLALKSRLVDVANAEEVAALRQAITLEREHMAGVKATEEQYLRLQLVLKAVETRVESFQSKVDASNAQLNRFPQAKIQGGARALRDVAFAAESATLGGKEAISAFGNLATTLALTASSARFAAMASGIGAAVIVSGTLLSVWQQINREGEANSEILSKLSGQRLPRMYTELRKLEDEMARVDAQLNATAANRVALSSLNIVHFVRLLGLKRESRDLEATQIKALDLIADKQRDQALQERIRNRELRERGVEELLRLTQSNELLGRRADLLQVGAESVEHLRRVQLTEAQQTFANQQRAVEQMFVMRDEQDKIIPLTQEQRAQKAAILALLKQEYATLVQIIGIETERTKAERERELRRMQAETAGMGGNLRERFEAQLATIMLDKEAALAAATTGAQREAIEARTQARIRQLRRETLMQTIAAEKQLTDALLSSNNKTLKAIGAIADAGRRLKIGALAAEATVQSAIEFGRIPASLAVGDVFGAALHAAAGTELAAAAALGFKEALGGGGGARAGSGGGSANTPTFEPRASGGRGEVIINLITRDPFGRDAIQQVRYELDRAQILGVPIPPTRGLDRVEAA